MIIQWDNIIPITILGTCLFVMMFLLRKAYDEIERLKKEKEKEK